MVMPWEKRLAQAQRDVLDQSRANGKLDLRWRRLTLSGYLEGAAVALENPYPLWLLRRIEALRWGDGGGGLPPSLSLGALGPVLERFAAIPEQADQVAAVRFWLFCEIPYQLSEKEKGDALS